MREALILIGEIFLISCLQILIEIFVDAKTMPNQAKILSLACYAASLYLLMQFVFNNVLEQVTSVMRFTF